MTSEHIQRYYRTAAELGLYGNPDRLAFYLEHYLFKNIDFNNKNVIDIGGGSGLFGFYAAIRGANKVVVVEPEFDGSSNGMQSSFERLHAALGAPTNIELFTNVIENYQANSDQFDIVLMHNSVNHIDEEGCTQLPDSALARENYSMFFQRVGAISKPNALLLICDCTNKNAFNKLGITNPLMKTIECHKHQPPEVWADLASTAGFKKMTVSWTTLNALRSVGRLLFGNRLAAYFSLSHFRLSMTKSNP